MHLNRRMRIHSDGHTHTFARTQHHPPIHRYTDIFSEQVLCTAILASLLEWSFDVEMRISLGNDGDNADSDDNDHDDEEGDENQTTTRTTTTTKTTKTTTFTTRTTLTTYFDDHCDDNIDSRTSSSTQY